MARVLVGTSGWQYRHWRAAFYPQDVPQRRWLEYYTGRFATVENDGTFYRLPARETFEQWRARTPDGFVMAVKASRYLSHYLRLRDPAEPVRRMIDAFDGLKEKLGPVLIQLPPRLAADPALLDRALGQFPPGIRVAVEPRDPSWWTDGIREVLAARGAALCWADRAGQPATPLWRTADWGYLRFHEGDADPWPRYAGRCLREWADRVARAWPGPGPVYAYFNNDQGGAAVLDAETFARLTGPPALAPARKRVCHRGRHRLEADALAGPGPGRCGFGDGRPAGTAGPESPGLAPAGLSTAPGRAYGGVHDARTAQGPAPGRRRLRGPGTALPALPAGRGGRHGDRRRP